MDDKLKEINDGLKGIENSIVYLMSGQITLLLSLRYRLLLKQTLHLF